MKLRQWARQRVTGPDEAGAGIGLPKPAVPDAAPDAVAGEAATPAAIRQARAAREDEQALKAQAEHQARRAGRNVAASRRGRRARVLVVDDSPAFVGAAVSIVGAAPSLRIVGIAASGAQAIELLPELRPDLVLLDVNMPGLDGIESARVIRGERPDAVVILVSADPAGFESAGLEAGAVAVVDKRDVHPDTLEVLWSEHMLGR